MNMPGQAAVPGFQVSRIMWGGFLVIALFFGGFGSWATLAPLDSAAIAPGVIAVDSRRKTVQHFEGGIIEKILVDEGSQVAAGQDLIILDNTQAQAQLGLVRAQYHSALALKARLEAERDGLRGIGFPAVLSGKDVSRETRNVLATQRRIFKARAQSQANQVAIFAQRAAQLEEEITGLQEEIHEQDQQIALLDEELASLQKMVDRGFDSKPRLLALEREKSEVAGARAQNRSKIARARQSIGETHLQVTDLKNERQKEVAQQLREVETEIADLQQRIAAASDVFTRTSLKAPVSGTVVNLQVFTTGGVISPGQPLMDIVPQGDRLVIEARVEPNDIDTVHADLPAKVRLTAFAQSVSEVFDGRVIQVSADRLTDERSGSAYYQARVVLNEGQVELDKLELLPGMPAEVMIVTGKRTPLDYLLKPILTSFGRALKEE